MSDSIRISPKHGVNPCIPICAFCGQEKNEIVFMGKLKDDAEAPMHAVLDYQPCDDCLSKWALGVPLVRVTSKEPAKGAVTLTENDGIKLYPTGQYTVVTPEAAKRLFNLDMPIGKPALMDEEPFDMLIDNAKKSGVINENGDVVK